MAKIHTHYDNLKVARLAPQEVIRAAYKALSQKYHPDKNPGDEKAARIMAILNSAYGTLADPQRRREHDEWIAAEEWEVEWLESTSQDDGRGKRPAGADLTTGDAPMPAVAPRVRPPRHRDWVWWSSLAGCLVAGGVLAMLVIDKPAPASAAVPGAQELAGARPGEAAKAAGRDDALIDSWAAGRLHVPEPSGPQLKVALDAQVVLPAAAVECEPGAHTLQAPSGEAWPQQTGYITGFPVSNQGHDLQLTVDNGRNPLPVFVKLYDMERRSNVRYMYILARDKMLLDGLTFGRYEVRFQNVDLAGTGKDGCRPTGAPPADVGRL